MLVWALLTGRNRAVMFGLLVLGLLAVAATMLAGGRSWTDFLSLIRRVSDPIATAHNFTPGAVAYQAGMSRDTAQLLQYVSIGIGARRVRGRRAVVAGGAVVPRGRGCRPAAFRRSCGTTTRCCCCCRSRGSLERGWTWTVLIPLATSVPLVVIGIVPPVVYPAAFGVTLFALLAAGFQDRGRRSRGGVLRRR